MNKSDRLEPWLSLCKSSERFWLRVSKGVGCWEWKGRLNKFGYGQFDIANKNVLAHRVAYFLGHRNICANDCIMHTCDNPKCCNPSHLVAGTHAQNMADMKAKGRRKGINTGSNNGRAKLDQESANRIRLLRLSGQSLKALAEEFAVSKSTISRVCNIQNWQYNKGNNHVSS